MDGFVWMAIGAIISGIISYYFYKKQKQRKRLTPFLQYSSAILSDIDPDLKSDLTIHYKGSEIDNLYETQFFIKNNGDKPISGIIKPLTINIPLELTILDFGVLKNKSEDREVSAYHTIGENLITFDIPLLNKDESFTFKLIFRSDLELLGNTRLEDFIKEKFKFSITVDELPPTLDIMELYKPIDEKDKPKGVGDGITILFLASIATYVLLYFTKGTRLYLFDFSEIGKTYNTYDYQLIAFSLMVCWLMVSFGYVIGMFYLFSGISNRFKKSTS